MFDRVNHAARGRDGGQDGAQGKITLDDGTVMRPKGWQHVPAGRRLVLQAPGGGGFGRPGERSDEAQSHRPVPSREHDRVSERPVQNVRHRVCVGDDRPNVRTEVTIERQPRIAGSTSTRRIISSCRDIKIGRALIIRTGP